MSSFHRLCQTFPSLELLYIPTMNKSAEKDKATPESDGKSQVQVGSGESKRITSATKGFLADFRVFALKGNAVDMAVGIIIGAAFNKVVQSIVNDLLMPPLGYLINGVPFKELRFILKEGTSTTSEVAISYGLFINTVIEFLIIAFTVFVVVKMMNRLVLGVNKKQG